MSSVRHVQNWRLRATRAAVMGISWAHHTERDHLPALFQTLLTTLEPNRLNRRRVAIAGMFSAGKTTLLNGYLNLLPDQRLPVGLSETTAIPTLVRPSARSRLLMWMHGRLVEAAPELRTQFISLRKDAIPPLLSMFLGGQSEVVFETRMDEAIHDLEFLDTPGLSGSSPTSDERTLSSLLTANGILYVVNGLQGTLGRAEKHMMRDRIASLKVPVHVSVTHLDDKPDEEAERILKEIRVDAESIGIHRSLVARIDNGELNPTWHNSVSKFLAIVQSPSPASIAGLLEHCAREIKRSLGHAADLNPSPLGGAVLLEEFESLAQELVRPRDTSDQETTRPRSNSSAPTATPPERVIRFTIRHELRDFELALHPDAKPPFARVWDSKLRSNCRGCLKDEKKRFLVDGLRSGIIRSMKIKKDSKGLPCEVLLCTRCQDDIERKPHSVTQKMELPAQKATQPSRPTTPNRTRR